MRINAFGLAAALAMASLAPARPLEEAARPLVILDDNPPPLRRSRWLSESEKARIAAGRARMDAAEAKRARRRARNLGAR